MAIKKQVSESIFKRGFRRVKEIVFSTKGFPIFLSVVMLAVLFVVFRMKTIEFEDKISKVNVDIEKVSIENKRLKAQKAKLLSPVRLKKLARQYNLSEPGQEQIILVP